MSRGLEQTVMLDDGAVTLTDVRCRSEGRGPSPVETSSQLELVLIRAGAYARHTRQGEILADPTRVLVFRPQERYRVSHPLGGRDRSLVIGLGPDVSAEIAMEIAGGDLPSSFPLDLAGRRLADGIAARSLDPLELGGAVLAVAARILAIDAVTARRQPAIRPAHRRLVRRARLVLIERLGDHLTLPELASSVETSPFHLARVFRTVTGISIHRYRVELRVRAALERITAGERDLTRLALELGFSDHAHLTRTIRRQSGRPPSAFRVPASAAEIRRSSTIVQA